ncbi:MAG: hypothetical protein JSS86_02170 [Cyanobacteria bacterium SZAS LIN-2]|nr:hypothetical protein [Cyanobacteria bacterium SZAS LIN-3]MBS1995080.1 hypothetical protein [Cyanobacteria bacterium SZAS LIN-2]MBS2006187.1 hypothetical protein [Cyanobacteria bacterium SZAS TMP-1]
MQSTQLSCFSADLIARQPVAARLLANALAGERMAHALLLTGRALDDKWLIARQLAAFMNCASESRYEKGSCLLPYIQTQPVEPDDKTFSSACQNCRWLFRDEHPKAWNVLSKDAGNSGKIPVESARNLSEELARSSQFLRVVIINDASDTAFHRPAANALLKTIEEPRSNCLFVLFAQCEEDVLQTIVSRCQLIPLNNRYEDNIGYLASQSPPLKDRLKEGFAAHFTEADKELLQSLRSEIFLTTHPSKKINVKDAMLFAHHLGELLDDENVEQAFDLIVNLEIEQLAGIYRTNRNYSRYLEGLFKLADEAKRQWDHYVTKKGVCENFALAWLDLRQKLTTKPH